VENLDAVGNNPRAIPSANAGNQQQQRANAQANPQLAPANPNVNPNMNPRPPPMQTQGQSVFGHRIRAISEGTIADEEECLHVKTLLYGFHIIIRFLFK
jgi:hypothetical protein